jgi:hypothetical protein
MAVICRAYTSHDEAQRAVAALLGAGIEGGGLRVLMGERERDARDEVRGRFAGSVAPADRVADFAGAGHAARRPSSAAAASPTPTATS